MWKGFTSFCSSNYSHDIFNKVYLCVSISNPIQSNPYLVASLVRFHIFGNQVNHLSDCSLFTSTAFVIVLYFFLWIRTSFIECNVFVHRKLFLFFGHKLSSNQINCETIHLHSLKSIEKFCKFPPLYCQWQAFTFEIPTYLTIQSLTELQPAETCIYTKYASEIVSICNLFEWEQRLLMKWLVLYIYSWPKMKMREKHK